jgi:peptidoglycan biosynthesis protein MviN/MurJ (putative lipid II flippase)
MAISVGFLVLCADDRYAPVLGAQAVMILGAPLFVWTSWQFGLFAAAVALGMSRVMSAAVGYFAARRRYGVHYPWRFCGKVVLLSSAMSVILLTVRAWWTTSALEAASLTTLGAVIVGLGLRVFRIIGSDELDILERTDLPGLRWIARWLAG